MHRTMISARPLVALAALLATTTVARAETTAARADEERSKAIAESNRQLAGHVFTPSTLVQTPFSTTSFGTTTVLGSGTVNANNFDLQGNVTGTKNYDVV